MIAAILLQRGWWCPMCGVDGFWGTGGWPGFFWLLFLVAVVAAVWTAVRAQRPGGGRADPGEEALRERYARGEIDEATYERMRSVLRRGFRL